MQANFQQPNDQVSYGTVFREIAGSTKDLLQGEIRLAKAELKESAKEVTGRLVQGALAAVIIFCSLIPLTAFFVLGLGSWLDGNYTLSSFIIFGAYAIVGVALGMNVAKKFKEGEPFFSRTKASLEKDKRIVDEKISDIQDAANRRRVV